MEQSGKRKFLSRHDRGPLFSFSLEDLIFLFFLSELSLCVSLKMKGLINKMLLFSKVKFSRIYVLIKKLINIYNLIYFLFYYTFFNNLSPIKFNQFKYSQLMFFKNIKKSLNNM